MTWHKDKIEKYIKDNYHSLIAFFVFMLIWTLWCYFSGQNFVWKEINWISTPPIWERFLYSYLVYKTLGKWLYDAYFYKLLHFVCIGLFDNWRLYKGTKSMIWDGLKLLMCFCIIPIFVNLLNLTISFFYNLAGLILYIAPPIGIFLVLYAVYVFIKSENKILFNKCVETIVDGLKAKKVNLK